MKGVQIDLTKQGILDQIREGQMFQVQSHQYGSFKSQSYRSELGWLYFISPRREPVIIEYVDTLIYLDPLK